MHFFLFNYLLQKMIKNKDISLWKNCQNLTEDEIKSCDELNFLAKSQKYIENYLLDEDFESRGWMHFITGFWWSGKTSFINCILWQLKNSNFQFIKDKKVLPIFFILGISNLRKIFMNIFLMCWVLLFSRESMIKN